MNQFKRFSIASIVAFFFFALNVSCLRGSADNGNTVVTDIRSHNADQNDNLFGDSSLEKHGDDIAEQLVDGIVSALEKNATASFLEGAASFDFKKEAKAQAKAILKEMLKIGITPLEEIVAGSVKPPTVPAPVYGAFKPVIVSLFNKAEKALKVDVPDSIWDYEDESSEDVDEDGYEEDDDSLDF